MSSSKAIYEFGDWRLDPAEQLLLRGGQPVPLTPKVFKTLLLLVENAGRLVTKQEFMDRVWPDTFVEDSALAQNISQLRKTLALASALGLLIETVPKRGYRLLGPVRLISANGNGSSGSQAFGPTTAMPEAAGEQRARVEEKVATAETSAGGRLALTPSPARRSRSFLVAGVTLAALVLIVLATFGILRRGRSIRGAGAGLPSRAGTRAENQSAPKISPLISLPGEQRMPAFSPDGSRVAFVWHNPQPKKSGIYAVVVGSQSLLQLTTNASDICPTWSPDGRYLAFERVSQDKFSIYMTPALGGPERRIYSGTHSPWMGPEGLSFSPDGKLLAFSDWSPEMHTSLIKSIALDDSTIRSITSPPNGYHDAAPAFAPDGNQIAFVRSTGPILLDELYVLSLSGGEPRRLTSDNHRVFGSPVWTHDGREILFASNRAGLKSLWRIPASGGLPQPVLGPGPVADNPSISSSTGELVYEYSVEDENLWRVDIQQGESRQPAALFSSKTSNLMPQFSPDGRKIAFEGDRSGYEEIWICDPDGSNPVQVTKLGAFSGSPRWSPDGTHLVFDSRREGHSGIYTVDVSDGSDRSVRSITTFPDANNVVPSWSRDGHSIYFASDHGSNTFHIWRVPVEGGPPVQVTKGSGFAAFESADGRSVFYAKLSEPGLWRVPKDGGPESLVWQGQGPDNWGNWELSKDAIYFIEPKPGGKSVIERLDLKTKHVSYVTGLERPSFYGLTVSPKGTIVYAQRDRDEHDIVMTKLF